jgi:hypothetical protein
VAVQRTCKQCRTPLQGRATTWCDACRPGRSNRKTLAEAARKRGERERAEQILRAGKAVGSLTDTAPTGPAAWAALILASHLAATQSLATAWARAGLQDSGLDPAAVEREARAEYGDLIELRAEGMQRLGWILAVQALARLGPAIPELPVGQVASTVKGVVDALERLQNSVRPTFGSVSIVWDFGEEADA